MEYIAIAKNIKMSPRKVRLIVDSVKKQNLNKSLSTLSLMSKRAAMPVKKAIDSAIANAVNNFKVNPIALRLGIHQGFKSVGFYSKKSYSSTVLQDIKIRKALFEKLRPAGVGDVVIERSLSSIKITIYVTRPGIVIGRGGTGLEELKKHIVQML